MKRRLPVTAPFVHARRIDRQHVGEQIVAIQVRCRAGIRYCTGFQQARCGRLGRGVQRVKATRPPRTTSIRIRAEVE